MIGTVIGKFDRSQMIYWRINICLYVYVYNESVVIQICVFGVHCKQK